MLTKLSTFMYKKRYNRSFVTVLPSTSAGYPHSFRNCFHFSVLQRISKMKAALFVALAICATVAVSVPAPGAPYGGIPPAAAAFIPPAARAFIPTPEEIAALNALKTTPAPGAGPFGPSSGPVEPPTMPPAVANLVNKYKAAAAAFAPPTPAV
ncbi:uncharacterized protein [Macrobrachium rosenbergii]|uniref:uncharacterized protein n=1 Tax=Macrobrachium rosenbergii TaxID=79674 RepID=UPI0034D7861E